jgi:MFS family permease
VPIFWGLLFSEASYGSYLGVWPLWIEHLGAPITVVGLVLGSMGVIRLLVLIPSAQIAERLGPRRTIMIGRSGTVVGLLFAASATHWTHLAPMLIGASMGSVAFPILQSLITAQAGDQQMRAFTIVCSIGPSIALIVAPLVSGAVVALWGMRAAFILGACCSVAALYFFSRIKVPSATPHHGTRPSSTYRSALGDPATRAIALLLLLTIFFLSLGLSLVPNFLEDVRGMEPAEITTIGAAAAIGSMSLGLVVARVRRFQRVPFALVAVAIALTIVSLVLFRFAAVLPLVVLAFFFRGGFFAAWAMLAAAAGELAPAQHRVRAFALCEMVGGFAISFGPVVAAPLYSYRAELPFEVAIVLASLLVPALFLVQRWAHGLAGATRETAVEVPVTST